MVKFEAPEHTKGPLCGYSVRGCWYTTARDPQWRGDVGTEEYSYRHHYEPAGSSQDGVDPAIALGRALRAWCEGLWPELRWRPPDSVTVDAVYQSSLSRPAGSQDDPFLGLEGTGHDGYERTRRTNQRGRTGE